jgi:hypothetical protein
MTKVLKTYYKTLRKTLICSGASKTRFLKETEGFVEDFLKDKPDATLEDINKLLGEPTTLSKTFAETLNPAEVRRHRRIQKAGKALAVVLPVAIIILLCVLIYYITQAQLAVELTKETVIHIYEI